MKALYMVVFECEETIEPLSLSRCKYMPPGGVLDWYDKSGTAALFSTRAGARAAINRTHYYALAFALEGVLPPKRILKIVKCSVEDGLEETK